MSHTIIEDYIVLPSTLVLRLIIAFTIFPTVSNVISALPTLRDASPFRSGTVLPDILEPCIMANPDIAGPGVRYATYLQCFLITFPTLAIISGGYLNSRGQQFLRKNCNNIFITAYALVVLAFFQSIFRKLSLYHTLIVLNLSWMMNTTTAAIWVFPVADDILVGELPFWEKVQGFWPSKQGHMPVLLLVSFHVWIMAILGFMVWHNPAEFGVSPQCAQVTYTSFLYVKISALNPAFRITSLIIYSLAFIPFISAALMTSIALLICQIIVRLLRQPHTFRRLYVIIVAIQIIVAVLLLIDTELMIHRSKAVVIPGDSDWTFGQMLAMLLVIGPFFEAVNVLKAKFPYQKLNEFVELVDYQFYKWRRVDVKGWPKFYPKTQALLCQLETFFTTQPLVSMAALRASQTAIAALHKSNDIIGGKNEGNADSFPSIEGVQNAARVIAGIREDITLVCRYRFPSINDKNHFTAVQASLKAARSAMDAAAAALRSLA